jgi:hypothetical protein
MGTAGGFEVDADVTAWLYSQLVHGPMGALPGGRRSPHADRVCTVVAMIVPETGNLETVVLMDGGPEHSPSPFIRIADDRELTRFLSPRDAKMWEAAFVKYIRTPEVYLGPGDEVTASKRGCAGARVTWNRKSPKVGILTAGHVIGSNKTARVGGSVGTVAFSIDFANSGTTPEADVAVIELSDDVDHTFKAQGSAKRGDMVDFIIGGDSRTSQISAVPCEGIFMKGRAGTVGYVYLAHPSVTDGGDSGALAINSSQEVIGHLLGGSGEEFDFIQEIGFQMRNIKIPDISI